MVNGKKLREIVDAHHEWLLIRERGKTFPLNRDEIEVKTAGERTLFGFIDDDGFHSWRLNSFTLNDIEIVIDVAGPFGKKQETMRLVPRTPATELTAEIELARLKAANEIAATLELSIVGTKLTRVALNTEGGRLAQILFTTTDKTPTAAIADVTAKMAPEAVFTAAMTWLEMLGLRKKNPVNDILIICEKRHAKNAQKLHALLTDRWREKISVVEINRKTDPPHLITLSKKRIADLWREKQKRFVLPESQIASKIARAVTMIEPDKIDAIYSKHGETLRFMGLPFVRIRKTMGKEKAWFGVGKYRQILTAETWKKLEEMVGELDQYRTADPLTKRHEYYRAGPEAWLEAILRRNIEMLDANLILSPIYNQFRSSNDKIDLLALRKDGRLVVIELKTQPDREMVFQAADYWRKIELQRRRGDLAAANLFGNTEIADKPTIVYLAAPAWSFHRDFEFFARAVSPEIELWRFELHENWREQIKVVARNNYNG